MTRLIFILSFSLLPIFAIGQAIQGKVVDENGDALPFATLYIENTTRGTTTNAEGNFQITVASENTKLVFQFVGYEKLVKEFQPNDFDKFHTIQLVPQTYQLAELIVTANGEDPAYRVIREAMKKRKHYEREVKAYSCDVYIKGIQTITEKPDRFLGFKVTLDSGIVYLSESVSRLYYAYPDKVKEIMISSKVSGRNNAFSYNQASDMLFNPYENLFKYENISERGFVSPIANNAMNFYEYQLEGTHIEDSLLINKIKVIGKRETDPVFNGYIYIVEDSWRIHSVDMLLTKSNQIEFVDSLWINQVYAPVTENIWMLLSQKFDFKLSAFGFKGQGTFIGVHSNYKVAARPDSPYNNEIGRKIFPNEKKFFNNEILSVQDGANERDSSYWNQIRPIPLTPVEIKDYEEKDRLQKIKETKAYKDSVDRITNQPGLTNLFLTGYVFSRSFQQKYFRFEPLTRIFFYNTVEGPAINLGFTLTKRRENRVQYQLIPNLRYGFSNKELHGSLKGFLYTNHHTFERFGLEAGKTINQFNNSNPITLDANTFQTLINRRNLIKLYSQWTMSFHYRRELVNGLLLRSSLGYHQRSLLSNSSHFSIFDEGEREFTSNYPDNLEDTLSSFPKHNALILDIELRIRFGQTFITRPDRKIIIESKYPEITVGYQRGINILHSTVNFDFLELAVSDRISMGLLGMGNYKIGLGGFLNKNQLYFMDYKHFNGNRAFMTSFSTGKFQLLDYYLFSTKKSFSEAHYEHHFNGFIMDKIPFLKRTKIQTVCSVHTFYTEAGGNYIEYGLGLEHIFKIARVDYYISTLKGNNYNNGIRIGLGF